MKTFLLRFLPVVFGMLAMLAPGMMPLRAAFAAPTSPVGTSTTTRSPAQDSDAGFTFEISPEGMTIREYSFPDEFFTGSRTVEWARSQTFVDVTLNRQPTANVVLPVSSSDTAEATVDPVQLIFTPDNWNVKQRITVSSVDDITIDGDKVFDVITGPAVSPDPSYSGLDPQDIPGTNLDHHSMSYEYTAGNRVTITDEGLMYRPDVPGTIQRVGVYVGPNLGITQLALCGPYVMTGVTSALTRGDGTVLAGSYGPSVGLSITGAYLAELTLHDEQSLWEISYPGYYPLVLSQLRGRTFTNSVFAPTFSSLGCTIYPPAQVPGLAPVRPYGTDDAYSVFDGSPQWIPPAQGVLENDTPMVGQRYYRPLRAKLVTPPNNGTIDLLPDGSFTYTAAASYEGTDSFTYLPVQNELEAASPVTVTLNVTYAPPTPTAATLINFAAHVVNKTKARLNWETGSEATLLGFNVYRAANKNGPYQKRNPDLIAAKQLGTLAGDTYKYTDKKPRHAAVKGKPQRFFYKLELVYADGASEWSEIARVTIQK